MSLSRLPQDDKTYRWDFSKMFTGDDDPQIEKNLQAFTKATKSFVEKWSEREDYLSDVEALAEALQDYEGWSRDYAEPDAAYYSWLRSTQEQTNPVVKANLNRVDEQYRDEVKEIQFFTVNLSTKTTKENQEKFVGAPALAGYKHFLETVFAEAPYILSEQEEKVLTVMVPTSFSKWVKMTDEFLNKETVHWQGDDGEEKELSFSELIDLISNTDQQTRDDAAAKLNEIFRKHIHTGEAEINSVLAYKKTIDKLRGYERPDQARHISDDISSEVVDVMLDAVTNNFDVARRFYQLKAKLLSKDKLMYHERNVPIGKVDKVYEYEESLELIKRVFAELDPQFAHIVEIFEQGQIDVFPRQGKSGGAFCAYGGIKQPVYVLLNYQGKLRDILTMAHEFGHGINDELMRESVRPLDYGTPLSTAEVASTFMEDFVLQELLKSADDETKLNILMQRLNDDVSTIFRQVACYRFEQALHTAYREENFLSHERIGKIFQENMAAYMGESVEQSAGSQNWWLYWSHIRSFFYVYSYASGSLISKAMQAQVHENPAAIAKVKTFLSAGRSRAPQQIFEDLGIDIAKRNFWETGIGEIALMLEQVEDLAQKLGMS